VRNQAARASRGVRGCSKLMAQEPLSFDLEPRSNAPVSAVPYELPEAMRPAYRRRGDTRRNYATEQALDRIAPAREVEGTWSIEVRCSHCPETVKLDCGDEEPGQLVRAVAAGLLSWPTLRSGVVCGACGDEA
jgi:hypothetical protein